jgi:hyperosmotically inducible periplasmic protein
MAQKRMIREIATVVLLVTALATVALFAAGCDTSQSADRQMRDAQITTQVKAKLASDVRASSITNIDVNTTNGVVTLAGQVESSDIRHSAETVAAAVPGVVRVNNELQVATAAASQ